MTEPLRNRSVWADVMADARSEAGPSTVMSDIEVEAMNRAGRDAGGYLVGIGKTDMATLSKEEWQKFSSVMVLGFELWLTALRNDVTA